MSIIKIQRLTLENFKCHRHLSLDFSGRGACIYGDNATGKTSVYDAFYWLLFGKDSQGQSDEKSFCIKPVSADGGVLDHEAVTSVKAELTVDGTPLTLERTLREVWTTRRGSAETVYSGNTSDYFVDGVPCKKNEYERRISEFISEDVFRLLTDIRYFSEKIKWQDRRKVLFDISGALSDSAVMDTDSRFAPLKEAVGRLSVTDYSKKMAAEKRGLTGTRDEIPARIDELQLRISHLSALDYEEARQKKAELEVTKEGVSVSLAALDNSSARAAKQNEINAVRLELQKLKAENNSFRWNQTQAIPSADSLKRELAQKKQLIAEYQDRQDVCTDRIRRYDSDVEEYRTRWIAVNCEAFTGGVCPTCGQPLPEDKLKAAMEKFQTQKKSRLDELVQAADKIKDAQAALVAETEALKPKIDQAQSEADRLEARIAEVNTASETAKGRVRDMDGYAVEYQRLTDLAQKLQTEYDELLQDTSSSALRAEIGRLDREITGQMEIIAQERQLRDSQERIAELRKQQRDTAERLERISAMQYLVEEFTRYKAGFVEDTINSCFRKANFRLFRNQTNGGVEDRCDVTYQGVVYGSLNNGMRINVGIDIINTLSKHYGMSVPLFVDNAESVTELEPFSGQMVRLSVSGADRELRCEYED